jgi:hypothetical protein
MAVPTVIVTVPFPYPPNPAVTRAHRVWLAAVHEQVPGALTDTVSVPPVAAIVALVGLTS